MTTWQGGPGQHLYGSECGGLGCPLPDQAGRPRAPRLDRGRSGMVPAPLGRGGGHARSACQQRYRPIRTVAPRFALRRSGGPAKARPVGSRHRSRPHRTGLDELRRPDHIATRNGAHHRAEHARSKHRLFHARGRAAHRKQIRDSFGPCGPGATRTQIGSSPRRPQGWCANQFREFPGSRVQQAPPFLGGSGFGLADHAGRCAARESAPAIGALANQVSEFG